MTRNTRDNHDALYNIVQILLKYEKIYLVKFVIFLVILATVYIGTDRETIDSVTKQDIIGTFTFVLSVTVDCVILTRVVSSNIKGCINVIHLVFTFIMFLCSAFVVLIFMEKIAISSTIVYYCNGINILCCASPMLELAYDTILHRQNEIANDY